MNPGMSDSSLMSRIQFPARPFLGFSKLAQVPLTDGRLVRYHPTGKDIKGFNIPMECYVLQLALLDIYFFFVVSTEGRPLLESIDM